MNRIKTGICQIISMQSIIGIQSLKYKNQNNRIIGSTITNWALLTFRNSLSTNMRSTGILVDTGRRDLYLNTTVPKVKVERFLGRKLPKICQYFSRIRRRILLLVLILYKKELYKNT